MVRDSKVAGKRPTDYSGESLDALLKRRGQMMAALEELDAALEARGVRATERPGGPMPVVTTHVLAVLEDGPATTADVVQRTGQTSHAVRQMLSKLVGERRVRRLSRGLYALPEAL